MHEKIMEYLNNLDIRRLSMNELKTMAEITVMIDQYEDSKKAADEIESALSEVKAYRV